MLTLKNFLKNEKVVGLGLLTQPNTHGQETVSYPAGNHPQRDERSLTRDSSSRFISGLRITLIEFRSRGSLPRLNLFKLLKMPNHTFIFLIRIYQNSLALIFPSSCRFYPSCSNYGIQALKKFGLIKGSWLTFKRICKCHPFHPGGYDPI